MYYIVLHYFSIDIIWRDTIIEEAGDERVVGFRVADHFACQGGLNTLTSIPCHDFLSSLGSSFTTNVAELGVFG